MNLGAKRYDYKGFFQRIKDFKSLKKSVSVELLSKTKGISIPLKTYGTTPKNQNTEMDLLSI